jgi:hypothetical protein
MKKIFAIIAIMALSMISFAQFEFYPSNKTVDSTAVVDSTIKIGLYGGGLLGGQFCTDTVQNDAFTSIRLGFTGSWKLTKRFAVESDGIYQWENNTTSQVARFWVKYTPIKKIVIKMGYLPTLVTEHRPPLVSADNQFETFTQSRIPGGTYNFKVVVNDLGKFGFGTCVAYRDTGFEYQAMLKYDWAKVSSWYGSDEKFGAALTLDFERVYNITSWKQDKVIANFICLKFGEDKDYQIISDNGYDLDKKELVRSESGFLKTFNSRSFFNSIYPGGLWGLTYRYETRSINAYLFINLASKPPQKSTPKIRNK